MQFGSKKLNFAPCSMKKLHLAISTNDIAATVQDYSDRLNAKPSLVEWAMPTLLYF